MVDPSLVKGITDALVGGALGGLDAASRSKGGGQTNNLGAFLQAQQNALARADKQSNLAYSNFSTSIQAKMDAFRADPKSVFESDVAQEGMRNLLAKASSQVDSESTRSAMADVTQSLISQMGPIYENAVVTDYDRTGAQRFFLRTARATQASRP